MVKRILPASSWQRPDDPVRRIATRGRPALKADLKEVLGHLPQLIPDRAVTYARRGDWHGFLNSMDWNHFGQTLRAPFGQIGKIREAASHLGAQQVNDAHRRAGRKVRFRKAYDPDEPRDERGRWTSGSLRTSDDIRSLDDLKAFADNRLPPDTIDHEFFYHSTRTPEETEAIGREGLRPGAAGKSWLSKDEVRGRGGGYVVVRVPAGKAVEGVDRVEAGLQYREWTVPDRIPASDVVRVVGAVRLGGGHTISEDELADYAYRNQGLRDQDVDALPEKYRRWFDIGVRKYSPSQPRDERGRWVAAGTASTAKVKVGDRDIKVTLSRADQAIGSRLVNLDVRKFDAAWKRDKSFYTGPGGVGESSFPGRYSRFQEWIRTNDHMEASSVGVMDDGAVGFTNGRHRYAVLRDMGIDTIPVAMDKESRTNAKRHGYLSDDLLKFYRGAPGLIEEPFSGHVEKIGRPGGVVDGYLTLFAKDIGDEYAFDLYTQDVQDALRQAQDDLIAQLSQSARDTVETVVLNGVRTGLSPEQTMDDIRQVIGLTSSQAQAVLNYRDMLENLDSGALDRRLRNFLEDDTVQAALDAGEPLDQAMVDKLVNDYTDNYLDYRAEAIAQTESTRAANAGLQDAYEQAIDRGVFTDDQVRQHWRIDTGENVCPICRSIPGLNPDGVPVGENFDSIDGPQDAPPVHVHCQCSVEMVTDLGTLTAESDTGPDETEAA